MNAGKREVVVTGMGVVTAQGVGVEATWRGVVEGREVLRGWEGVPEAHPLRKIKVAICGEVERPHDLPERFWRKLSRTQQLACAAMDEALGRAGLGREVGRDMGLFVATTVCGMDQTERFYAQYREDKGKADVELMRRLQPFEVRDLLARRHGFGETGWVCLSTCVGSAMAIAAACDAIQLGECDVAVAGGSEGMCRVVLSGFHSLKVTAMEGCRPFDKDRPGMTVGEGAGMVVLESAEHARGRGAEVLAVVRGVGISCDAHHLTAPDPMGVQAVRAMREALARSGMSAGEIGYVNAHGTGTRDNDAMEARAIEEVFGKDGVWVSSTKRGTGHTFGAAGVVETVIGVQALREGILPVNAGSVMPEEGFGIRVVRGESVREKVGGVMSTNFAFGGNNTAIVLTGGRT